LIFGVAALVDFTGGEEDAFVTNGVLLLIELLGVLLLEAAVFYLDRLAITFLRISYTRSVDGNDIPLPRHFWAHGRAVLD
jgi:hypothetical protein